MLQIVKNTNELINKCYDNLEKNADLFQNDHLRSDKVWITVFKIFLVPRILFRRLICMSVLTNVWWFMWIPYAGEIGGCWLERKILQREIFCRNLEGYWKPKKRNSELLLPSTFSCSFFYNIPYFILNWLCITDISVAEYWFNFKFIFLEVRGV